jgi:hypothetical protein
MLGGGVDLDYDSQFSDQANNVPDNSGVITNFGDGSRLQGDWIPVNSMPSGVGTLR